MAKRQLPSPDELRQLLNYDPETGLFVWKRRPEEMFEARGSIARATGAGCWNGRWAGRPAFGLCTTHGYMIGSIQFQKVRAHRVAWAMHYGAWPNSEVDHINGNRADNRINNLRLVTSSENKQNMKRRTDCPSGVTGVYWWPQSEKWRVQIAARGIRQHIGMFKTFEEAVAARKAAEARLGFHENHGRAA